MHQLRGGHMGLGTKPILEATLVSQHNNNTDCFIAWVSPQTKSKGCEIKCCTQRKRFYSTNKCTFQMNIRVHSPLMENNITLTEKNQIFLLYCYVQILVPIFSIFSAILNPLTVSQAGSRYLLLQIINLPVGTTEYLQFKLMQKCCFELSISLRPLNFLAECTVRHAILYTVCIL